MADPWDRQPGEPNRWYSLFTMYLTDGPRRSLLGLYKRTRKRPFKTEPSSSPAPWKAAAEQWHWHDRAEAFDEMQRQRLLNEHRTLVEQVFADRLAAHRELLHAGREVLRKFDRKASRLAEASSAINSAEKGLSQLVGGTDLAQRVESLKSMGFNERQIDVILSIQSAADEDAGAAPAEGADDDD